MACERVFIAQQCFSSRRISERTRRVVRSVIHRNEPLIDRRLSRCREGASSGGGGRRIDLQSRESSSKAQKAGCIALALAMIPVFAAGFLNITWSGPNASLDSPLKISYEPFATICINSDSEFATEAGENGWPGNGTEESPFLIGGYSIDASGHRQAIYIGNTSVHFIISGCHLSGADESGIHLLNVTNSTIIDNQCVSNTWYGVALVSSEANNVSGNTCDANTCGILLLFSDLNVVSENVCPNNGDGIVLRTSLHNEVVGNNCSGSDGDWMTSFGDGIRLFESNENEVSENSCYLNERSGIRLESSNGCTLRDNNCKITLYYSDANLVSGLNLVSMGYFGAVLDHSDANTISNCTNGGISLEDSHDNMITGCGGGTIKLSSSSSWNTVSGNNCSRYGIELEDYANNNTISNNDCTSAVRGISLVLSRDNTVSDNDARYNKGEYISMGTRPPGYGVYMDSSDANSILRNDCSYTQVGGSWFACGIYMYMCESNTLSENTVTHNEGMGVYVFGSWNVIQGNIVENNGLSALSVERGGILLADSDLNLIEGNIVRFNQGIGLAIVGDENSVLGNQFESNLGFGVVSDSSVSGNIYEDNEMVNDGISPDSEHETVGVTNVVNGRPVQHLKSCSGGNVPAGAGQIILYMCDGVTVSGQNLSMADVGLELIGCTDCTVRDNNCTNEMTGISMTDSSFNSITSNNLSANSAQGLLLVSGDHNEMADNGVFDNVGFGMVVGGTGNRAWNNTFVRNNGAGSVFDSSHRQAYSGGSNFWNLSSFGNYWGDWTTPDLNYDCIVDQPYVLSGGGSDYYPRTSPTVPIPPEPIPEFGPGAIVFLVFIIIVTISTTRRLGRR